MATVTTKTNAASQPLVTSVPLPARAGSGMAFFEAGDVPPSQRGFALLLVIWVLALLALLAAGVAADTSSEAVIARNRLDIAGARDAADSGVALAILGLLDPDPTKRLPADGRDVNFQIGNRTVAVSIVDEGGKIDLNTAPSDMIAALADELEIDASDRNALLAGIAARRENFAKVAGSPALLSSPLVSDIGGADPGGRGMQAFADTSEIWSLLGLSHGAAARLLPYFTVYSQRTTLNPLTATREALLAVPGISPAEVDFFIAARYQPNFEKPALSGVDRYVGVTPLRAVTITARARTATATFTREAVVLVSGNLSLRPYRILRWQQPREVPPSLAPAS
jgi:general secretion pathway protein K